jgi:hypothetical protein
MNARHQGFKKRGNHEDKGRRRKKAERQCRLWRNPEAIVDEIRNERSHTEEYEGTRHDDSES